MRGKKWFKNKEYDQPKPAFELGDGSIVEVVLDPDERHPEAVKITRVWPDDHVTTVRKVPAGQFSQPLYLSVEGDRSEQQQHKGPTLDEQLASGDYRPPNTITSIVPGNKPGDGYDTGTGQTFGSRRDFSKYYADNHLEKIGMTDIKNFPMADYAQPAEASRVKAYDAKKAPPSPSGRYVTASGTNYAGEPIVTRE